MPKSTQKTSLSIVLPLALPLLQYEELISKGTRIQTESTLFKSMDDDYLLYHTNYR